MSSSAPIVDRIRIIPRPEDFLDRNVGASGEVFFSRDSNTLRVYSGKDRGGFEVARADLSNVDTSNFLSPLDIENIATVTYVTTIEGPRNADIGNKYVFDGEYRPELKFVVGYTYVFNQNNQTNVFFPNPPGGTNNQHPLNFSADNLNGELAGGTAYLTGVTYKLNSVVVSKANYWLNFAQSTQRSVEIKVTSSTPKTLYYWCQNHLNMGNTITVSNPGPVVPVVPGGASVDVSLTVPQSPEQGNLWFNSNNGKLYIYINDGDSEQWVQPAIQPVVADYNALINRPSLVTRIDDLLDVDTATLTPTTGQVLKWDGTRWAPANDATLGAGGSDADTLDGQDSTYYLNYNNLSNTPTTFSNLTLTGLTTIQQSAEIFSTINGATGTVVHDFSAGAIWYHTAPAANFTANFTNVPTTASRAISVALVLNQGVSARLPTAIQINGASTTLRWQGGAQPTPNASQIDVVSFTLLRVGNTWIALGSLTTYNT